MLVPVDAPTDPILSPIDPVLLGLGQVAIVRRHVPFLAVLHAGFPFLQIAGFFRSQGAILDAVGDAVLLVGFATVYPIHARVARIDDARPAPEMVVVWATAEPVNISPPIARIKSEFESLLIILV